MGAEQPASAALRADDYINTATALGTPSDKSIHTTFAAGPDLTPTELEDLYEQESLAARIVDRVVDDAIRVDFELKDFDREPDVKSLKSELDDLDAINQLADAWRWARLYGGALLVLDVNDGVEMGEPLDLSKATSLRGLHVIESRYAQAVGYGARFGRHAFRRPAAYQVSASVGGSGIFARTIHASRCIRFDGVRVPPGRLVSRANGWGPSVLQRVWRAIRRLGSTEGYAEAILHELSVMVLKLKGLREQRLADAESTANFKKVIANLRWCLDNLSTLPLDTEDDYVESGRNVSGLDALLGRFVDAMVRATDMPRTILLGEQPGGLNANADSEVRGWFDHVATQQAKVLNPALTKLLTVIFALRAKRGEVVPSEWTIEWGSLWQPSAQEKATTRATNATADATYIQLGVQGAHEVRERLKREGEIEEGPLPYLEEADLGT